MGSYAYLPLTNHIGPTLRRVYPSSEHIIFGKIFEKKDPLICSILPKQAPPGVVSWNCGKSLGR